MIIVLQPGDTLVVQLHESDGEFTFAWGEEELTIHADLPDAEGREGEIYREDFARPDPSQKA